MPEISICSGSAAPATLASGAGNSLTTPMSAESARPTHCAGAVPLGGVYANSPLHAVSPLTSASGRICESATSLRASTNPCACTASAEPLRSRRSAIFSVSGPPSHVALSVERCRRPES